MTPHQIDPELVERFQFTDLVPRYAPDHVLIMATGDGKAYDCPVLEYKILPATTQAKRRDAQIPIMHDLPVLELVTIHGSRYYGVLAGYINSELRMVIIGTNPRDEVRVKWAVVPEDLR